MTDTTARTAKMDDALTRLAGLVDRPWDAERPEPPQPRRSRWRGGDPPVPAPEQSTPAEPFVVDQDEPPDRESAPRWWRDHPAADLLRRAGPARRVPIALVVGVLALVAVVAYFALSGNPTPEPAPDLAAATVDQPTRTSSAPPAPDVVVDVVGKVNSPGVRSLRHGSRVLDALTAAGGATPDADLTSLNLARPLTDGEQIRVGVPAPIPSAADPQNPPTAGPVDLNSATLQQLDTLPGVGTVTAQRILDWRTRHGRYREVAQLQEVDGIGPARFATLQELVVVR